MEPFTVFIASAVAFLGVLVGVLVVFNARRSEDAERGERREEFELEFDWEAPFDELPFEFRVIPKHFEFDVPPEHFEFHFPPEPFGTDEVNCRTGGV